MARLLLALCVLTAVLRAEDHVLLVGCTEYPNLRDEPSYRSFIRLFGGANDAAMLRDTLVDALGIPPDRITVLAGWDDAQAAANPTRGNILGWLDTCAKRVAAGDRVILHLAGHGSQQPDRSGDEPDGLDELFLPADVRGWNGKMGAVENAITDDELASRVGALRDAGAVVWLFLDSCHAGTMVRGVEEEERARRLPPALLGVPALPRMRGATRESPLEDLRGIAALYAAPSHRTTPEMRLPRGEPLAEWHGLFSWTLASQLRRTGGRVTFRQLHAQMVAAYQALPYQGTVPMAEGDLDRTLLGREDGRPPLWVKLDGDEVVLNAGRLAGVVPGTTLSVARLAGDHLGEVEVVAAELTSAVCRPEKGLALVEGEIFPASILSVPLGDLRLGVAVVADGDAPEDLVSVLQEGPFAQVRGEAEADWIVDARDPSRLRLRPARAGTELTFAVAPGELRPALQRIHRIENLRRCAAGGMLGELPSGLAVDMRRIEEGHRVPVLSGDLLTPGTRFEVGLTNSTGAAWDVTVLALDAHYGITELFPLLASPRLEAQDRAERVLGEFEITDDTQGVEHLLVLAVPGTAREPVSLGWLAGDRLRTRGIDGSGPELFEALAGSGPRSRGIVARPAAAAATLLTWRTGYGEIAPPRTFEAVPVPVLAARHGFDAQAEPQPWMPAPNDERPRGGLADLYRHVAPAVVVVRTNAGHGTGVYIDAEGHVLTNAHVVAEGYVTSAAGRPEVLCYRGALSPEGGMSVRDAPLAAEVVAVDSTRDLALLRLPADSPWLEGMTPLDLAPEGPTPGADCALIGHPSSGMLWTLRQGRVAQVGRMPHDLVNTLVARLATTGPGTEAARRQWLAMPSVPIVLSDCPANPGDSGSPLLDPQGRLFALTYAIPEDVRDDKFAYHVHVDAIREFLATPVPEAPHVPEAWQLGPRVCLGKTDPAGEWDLLIAGREKPEQLLLDLDGDLGASAQQLADLRAVVERRGFDAEVALHFGRDRRTAFYDTDNDGSFDLVLVDEDADPEADVRFTRESGRWRVETGIATHFLSADHLTYHGSYTPAVAKFRRLSTP